MPATSIFIKAASWGTSGIGYSRISVLLGPTLTAASTRSTTEKPPFDRCRGQSRTDARPVKRDFRAACARLRRVLLIGSEHEGRRGQDRWRCPEHPRYHPRCCGLSTSVPRSEEHT